MRTLALLLLGASLFLASCDKEGPSKQKAEDPHASMDPGKAPKGPPVEVPKEGRKFDPPIHPAQLPDGVWYCDMGTVEYARGEPGDGRCPICRMRLKQKVAEKK